jgi:glucosamine kinase
MTLVVGIDGGGSTVRTAVVRDDLNVLGAATDAAVNPSVIGHEAAAARIQAAVRAALQAAHVTSDEIAAAAIGVAGAAREHSETWLYEVVTPVLPTAHVVPSSDLEIALVGARGERRGILVLAGTGSAAYGVNQAGETLLVGGWGYLLGDEGSGYWLGMEALRLVAHADDRQDSNTGLTPLVLSTLKLAQPRDLLHWLYHAETHRHREIAALAPLVIGAAEAGDEGAHELVVSAAGRLAALGRITARRLHMEAPAFAFAGGLLQQPNLLSRQVCEALHLTAFPQRLHPPVIGAALLALLSLSESH